MLSKLLALVVIVITFASCSIFKKSEKHKVKTTLEVVSRKDSTFIEQVKKDSLERSIKVDKGVIITVTETTTTTERKGAIVKGSIALDKLKTGIEILVKDSAGFKISVLLDTLSNKLTAKSESPDEATTTTTKSTTTERKDSKEESEKSGSSEENKQVATSQEHRQKENVTVEDKKIEPKGSSFIWMGLAFLLVVIVLLWYFGIKRNKNQETKLKNTDI